MKQTKTIWRHEWKRWGEEMTFDPSIHFRRIVVRGPAPGFVPTKHGTWINPEPGVYWPVQTPSIKTIADDPTKHLFIIDDELNAVSLSVHGFPAIAMGGVWPAGGELEDPALYHELENVFWNGRTVKLIVDGTREENAPGEKARQMLMWWLIGKKANARCVRIPSYIDYFMKVHANCHKDSQREAQIRCSKCRRARCAELRRQINDIANDDNQWCR